MKVMTFGLRTLILVTNMEAEQDYDEYDEYDPDEALCWYCGGDGYGIVGTDWDEDFERGDFAGDIKKCPNCRGSGKAEDCTFW